MSAKCEAMKEQILILPEKAIETTDEKELFARIAMGDGNAFRSLFQLYRPLFSSVIYKITNDSSVVPDILQEVFMKIWLNRSSLDNIRAPRAWALQILYRVSFNWLRHQEIADKADRQIMQLAVKNTNEVEDTVYLNETAALLSKAINTLPPQTQKIYRLNREQDLKVSEIALQMSLSVQTVKNVLGKALKSIRNFLIQEGL